MQEDALCYPRVNQNTALGQPRRWQWLSPVQGPWGGTCGLCGARGGRSCSRLRWQEAPAILSKPARSGEEVERDEMPAVPGAPTALRIHPSPGRIRARLAGSKDEVCSGGYLSPPLLGCLSAFHTWVSSLPAEGLAGPLAAAGGAGGEPTLGPPPPSAAPQEEKQSPQHSMQISRQSADSQQASMMPQSMSQGRSQSAHSPELQQQQQMQESSEVQEPQVAQSSTMLQRVRNSQKRQERMQWTQQSAEERPESGRRGGTPAPTARLGEAAPNGWMLSPKRVEILPWELMEVMGRGAGSQVLL